MPDIYTVAQTARRQFVSGQVSKKLLITLYEPYHLLVNPAEFVDQAITQFPRLNCGLASVYLQYLLGQGQVIQGKYHDQNHTFLLANGEVVDITADQYGGPPIYLGKLQKPWDYNSAYV